MPSAASPALRRMLLGVVAAFAALVTLGVHGFSLPAWHRVLDGSPAHEVLWGEARPIRSDDWKVQIPQALTQASHRPAFPVRNDLVGLGQNMLVPVALPVAHPLTLFRPTLWGWFLGPDAGVAWQWWAQALGLFAAWLLVLEIVTGGSVGLAALASLALLVSPFLQFWALGSAPHAGYAALCFVAFHRLLHARSRRAIAGSALLLGWAGGCFALAVYPPFQVAMAWLLVFLAAGILFEARGSLALRPRLGARAAGLALGAAVAAGALAWLALDASEAIARMRDTVYPGHRIASGGDRSVPELLASNLALASFVKDDWGRLLNVCEAASFWLLFPVVGAGLLRRRAAGAPRDPVALALLLACAAFTVYCVVGVPEWLARATLLSLSPGKRAVLALGFADVLLLARVLSRPPEARRTDRPFALAVALAWMLLLALCARALRAALPGLPALGLGALVVANGALAFLVLRAQRAALPLAALVLGSGISTLWFNPVVRGGTAYLRENPVAQLALAADREAGGGTRWIAFGPDELGDLLRAVGLQALSGLHAVPQFELWQRLDPEGRAAQVYNRYAHVGFSASRQAEPGFRLISPDTFQVALRPTPAVLRALGVTHVLVRVADPALFEALASLERVGSAGEHHVYRVPPEDGGAPRPEAAGR